MGVIHVKASAGKRRNVRLWRLPSQLVSRSTALSHPDTMFQIYLVLGILVAMGKSVDMSNGLSSYQTIGRPTAEPQLQILTSAPPMAHVLPSIAAYRCLLDAVKAKQVLVSLNI